MYFPYLRGKLHELQALLEVTPTIFKESKLIPIIEPVNVSKLTKNRLVTLSQNDIPFILIINPTAHEAPSENEVLATIVDGCLQGRNNFILGFIVTENTTKSLLEGFFNRFPGRQKVLIHRGEYQGNTNDLIENDVNVEYNIYAAQKVRQEYINTTSGNARKVIVSDGFQRQKRNADYPVVSEFSNLSLNFKDLGYDGFGDYLTIGDHYRNSRGGGGAFVMAIHITSSSSENVNVRHFLSDKTSTDVNDQAGKFTDALEEFIEFYNNGNDSIIESSGIRKYLECQEAEHFPGNGVNKRYSMMHHIEQIVSQFS